MFSSNLKTFYKCDDRSENLFVQTLTRKEEHLKSEFNKLKIGEILYIDQNSFWIRKS